MGRPRKTVQNEDNTVDGDEIVQNEESSIDYEKLERCKQILDDSIQGYLRISSHDLTEIRDFLYTIQ